jgi:hypothetical protein
MGIALCDSERVGEVVQNRLAYSVAEFARLFSHHPAWVYRRLYSGQLRAIQDIGDLRIPASEAARLLQSAERYDPQPNGKGKAL